MLFLLVGISIVSATDTNDTITSSVNQSTNNFENSNNVISNSNNENINSKNSNNVGSDLSTLNYANSIDTSSVKSVSKTSNSSLKDTTSYNSIVSTSNSNKTATKHDTDISINKVNSYVTSKVSLKATIIDKTTNTYLSSGTVSFKVNGVTVGKSSILNGKAALSYNTNNLSAKTYTITVLYGESSTQKAATASNSMKLLSLNTKSTVNKVDTYVKNNINLVSTVVSNNKYVTDGSVTFKLDGITIGKASVYNGKAILKYNTASLIGRNYTITSIYSGSNVYNSCTSKALLVLYKLNTCVTGNIVYGSSSDKVTFVSTVTDTYSKYVTEGKVAFKINGKTIGVASVNKGKAMLTYRLYGLSSGLYTINLVYGGSNRYASDKGEGSLKISNVHSFTFSQIKEAAINLRNQFESNNIISHVTIGTECISLQDFLVLEIEAIKLVKEGKTSQKINYLHFNAPSTQVDTVSTGKISMSELLKLGNSILSYYGSNDKAPTYISTSLGKLGYYNILYAYSRAFDYATSTYLPSYVQVYPWSLIHPSNSKSRHIYFTSDNIYTNAKDKAYINSIISVLASKGYTATFLAIGPNTHNSYILNGNLPKNAVQVSIFGGSDAGVIYDMSTRYYMRAKENRIVIPVYYSVTSKDIRNLSWLERAHDDNYSPSSFKGIANPDKYLINHGYDFIYAKDVTYIANQIIKIIS